MCYRCQCTGGLGKARWVDYGQVGCKHVLLARGGLSCSCIKSAARYIQYVLLSETLNYR